MHCLLCHEKIPRLRAWTGKSEFCCDEHAELYKKQTMDRLLVDDFQFQSAPSVLSMLDGVVPNVDHVLLNSQPKKAKRANDDQETGEVDELWNLAERTGGNKSGNKTAFRGGIPMPAVSSESQGDPHTQSADEALAALQALAAQATPAPEEKDFPAYGDLLDEISSMDSSFEGLPPLEPLPVDLAAALSDDEIDEAPELELDSLEPPQARANINAQPAFVARAAALAGIDAPDLQLEGLAEAQQEALEPPELAADFEAEQAESLEPPDAALEELLAASEASEKQAAELSDPPEPTDFDLASSENAAAAKPVVVPTPRRAHQAAPKLRPSTEFEEMSPSPNLPEGGYEPKPWTDALAIAGPDRSSLLNPIKFLELRKSSLNGTASAKFDPVLFRASERIVAVTVPIAEPKKAAVSYAGQDDALTPRSDFAWPAPLHAALIAAEMRLKGKSEGISVEESFFSVRQPTLSAEFLGSVALQSRVLEPRRSTILSPQERDVFASATAEEEESGSESASAAGRSDRNETDGGEQAHVADLF